MHDRRLHEGVVLSCTSQYIHNKKFTGLKAES